MGAPHVMWLEWKSVHALNSHLVLFLCAFQGALGHLNGRHSSSPLVFWSLFFHWKVPAGKNQSNYEDNHPFFYCYCLKPHSVWDLPNQRHLFHHVSSCDPWEKSIGSFQKVTAIVIFPRFDIFSPIKWAKSLKSHLCFSKDLKSSPESFGSEKKEGRD